MLGFALQVMGDLDGGWRWSLIEQVEEDKWVFHSLGDCDCDFDSFQAALDAGTLALAKVMKQPYENERADPVGDAPCEG